MNGIITKERNKERENMNERYYYERITISDKNAARGSCYWADCCSCGCITVRSSQGTMSQLNGGGF